VLFALALLGNENVALYDSSLFDWSCDPDLPLAIGADRTGDWFSFSNSTSIKELDGPPDGYDYFKPRLLHG